MTEPAPAQDQPVTDWAQFAAAASLVVTSIGALLVFAGVTDPTHVGALAAIVGKIVVAVGVIGPFIAHLWAARKAKAQVTPVASPLNNAGEVLKTAEQWALEYGKHAAPAAPEPVPAPTTFTRGENPYTHLAAGADAAPEAPTEAPVPQPDDQPAEPPVADAFPSPAADAAPADTGALV